MVIVIDRSRTGNFNIEIQSERKILSRQQFGKIWKSTEVKLEIETENPKWKGKFDTENITRKRWKLTQIKLNYKNKTEMKRKTWSGKSSAISCCCRTTNSRYTRFGHLDLLKVGFILAIFGYNRNISHLYPNSCVATGRWA